MCPCVCVRVCVRACVRYLEVRGQLVGGEDTEFDLREADLQVLKVVALGVGQVLAGPLVHVLVQLLQLWVRTTQQRERHTL